MSSFYDDASLVMIPSCYKVGTVLCEKPTDGSGDLTFTRTGDTATRIAPNGLLEKVRTNLILQSQTFDNASWGKDTTTVTANAEVAPDGTLTADTMTISTDASRVTQGPTIGAGSFTASVYVKIISQTTAGDIRFLGVVDGIVVNVNFTPTNQWARYTATFTAATQITSFQLRGVTGGFVGTIAIWGFQLEASDFGATDYIPTTTAAVSVGPLANVPRLDYLGSSCPRLNLEPQRTNSITSSESTATGWTFTNSSSAVNQTASPDGYANADSIIPNATSGQHAINSVNITASGSFTLSAFVKAGEYTKVSIRESANTGSYASFNLATGTKIEDNVSGASFIQSYGNGWYRIGVTGTYSGTIRLGINVLSNAYTTGNPSSGTTFFSGNASDKLFCWGMQAELGATYATSYIPTLGAAVTRGADACRKTGISSLIGQTEGTLFVEVDLTKVPSENRRFLAIGDGTASNRIGIGQQSSTSLESFVVNGGSLQALLTQSGTTEQVYKIAIAYKANDFAFYINGVQVGTDTSGTVPSVGNLYLGVSEISPTTTQISDGISQALVFKTRLTNAELAELTTL